MLQIRDIVRECEYLRARILALLRHYNVDEKLVNDFYDEWNRTWSHLLYREEDLRPIFKDGD